MAEEQIKDTSFQLPLPPKILFSSIIHPPVRVRSAFKLLSQQGDARDQIPIMYTSSSSL